MERAYHRFPHPCFSFWLYTIPLPCVWTPIFVYFGEYLLCDNLPKFLFLKIPSVSHNSNLNSYPQSSIFSHPSDLPIIVSPDNLIFRFHCLATRMFHVKRSAFHSHFSYISIIRCSTWNTTCYIFRCYILLRLFPQKYPLTANISKQAAVCLGYPFPQKLPFLSFAEGKIIAYWNWSQALKQI